MTDPLPPSPSPPEAAQSEGPGSWRLGIRVMLVVYLVTLPACTQKVGHFGPGFFPFLAALFLVPAFALVSSVEAGTAWSEWRHRSNPRPAPWSAALMSLVALGYWGLILTVVLDKFRD